MDKATFEAIAELARLERPFDVLVKTLEKDLATLTNQYEQAKEALVLSEDTRLVALQLKGRITQLTNTINFLNKARTI